MHRGRGGVGGLTRPRGTCRIPAQGSRAGPGGNRYRQTQEGTRRAPRTHKHTHHTSTHTLTHTHTHLRAIPDRPPPLSVHVRPRARPHPTSRIPHASRRGCASCCSHCSAVCSASPAACPVLSTGSVAPGCNQLCPLRIRLRPVLPLALRTWALSCTAQYSFCHWAVGWRACSIKCSFLGSRQCRVLHSPHPGFLSPGSTRRLKSSQSLTVPPAAHP